MRILNFFSDTNIAVSHNHDTQTTVSASAGVQSSSTCQGQNHG